IAGPGTFYVRVHATNSSGTSAPSNEVRIDTGSGLEAPTNLAGLVRDASTVDLSWLPGPGVRPASYIIEAGSSSGASDLARLTVPGTNLFLSTPGVPPGTYFVRVRGATSAGIGAPSNEITVTVR